MKPAKPISRKQFLNRMALGAGGLVTADLLFDDEAMWCAEVETPYRLELLRTIPTKMDRVRGLAFHPENFLYIAGSGGVRGVGPNGEEIQQFSPKGLITGIVLDDEGTLYLAQPTRVQVLDNQGTLDRMWGKAGKEPGCYGYLTGIAISEGMLYLADAANRRVTRCAIDGDHVDEIEGFHIPSAYFDCDVDPGGNLWVGHTSRHQIEKYDGNNERIAAWGEYGPQPNQFCGCCNPTHLAVFPDGNLATAEKGIPRLKVYGPGGDLLAYLSPGQLGLSTDSRYLKQIRAKGEGKPPCHDGWPGMPLAISKEGDLAVAVPGSGTVRVYRLS